MACVEEEVMATTKVDDRFQAIIRNLRNHADAAAPIIVGQIDCYVRAAVADERKRCADALQDLLDGDFCGSDVEALRASIERINGGWEKDKEW